jgi:CubicO group peptidase (beta-lactamase class C family)
LLKKEKLPGLFVGVLNRGERQFFNFGYAVPDKKLPFDAATLFEAGSITKTFTAFILQSILQEKGIAEKSSILSYLPEAVQSNKALEPVDFLSLLNHTSGLPRLPENLPLKEGDLAPYDQYTEEDLFAFLKTVVPKPNGKSSYSNLGMGLAGVLAQRISGKDFPTLLHEYILVPFGMRNADSDPAIYRKSDGYFIGQKVRYWKIAVLAPAGSLQCTADEMLSYLHYMSRPADEERKKIIDNLLQPTVSVSPTMHVCKAWHTVEQKGKPVIYWHNGGTFGFSTFAAFVKETEQAVIVVANQFNANHVSDALGVAIMKKMLE